MVAGRIVRAAPALAGCLWIAACGGGGSDGGGVTPPPPPPAATYTIDATVSGITGGTLVLQVNGGADVNVTADGTTRLASGLANGATFAVTVKSAPATPPHTCTLQNATGTIAAADVTNVGVTCTPTPLQLASSSPANDAVNVAYAGGTITLTFSAPLATAPDPDAWVTLSDPSGDIPFDASVSGAQLQITPSGSLARRARVLVVVRDTIRGAAGEAPASAWNVRFTTRDGDFRATHEVAPSGSGWMIPAISIDRRGAAVAVWSQRQASINHFRANELTAGGAWQVDQVISANANVDTDFAAIDVGMDDAGNALAVYLKFANGRNDVWSARYTPSGGWEAERLIETGTGDTGNPRIAVAADGSAIAVWNQADASGSHIHFNRFTPASGWGSTAQPVDSGVGSTSNADISIGRGGHAALTWVQSTGGVANVLASVIDERTGSWSAPALLENGTTSASFPRVAVDAVGNALVVWSQRDGADENIYANRYVAGTGWGNATAIDSTPGTALDARVAFDSAGNAVALWYQSDGTRNNIWSNTFAARGGWGIAQVIETADGNADGAKLTLDTAGNAIVAWNQATGSAVGVYFSRYVPGTGWDAARRMDVGNTGIAGRPRIAGSPNGLALLVWMQGNTLLASRFD